MLNNRLLLNNSSTVTGVFVTGTIQATDPKPIYINVPWKDPIIVPINPISSVEASLLPTRILSIEDVVNPLVWGKMIRVDSQTNGSIREFQMVTKYGPDVANFTWDSYGFVLGGDAYQKPTDKFCWFIHLLIA